MAYRPNDMLSVAEAAAAKGVDVATIRRACVSQRIRCQKLNEKAWAIRWRDLEPWAPTTRGRKRADRTVKGEP